MPLSARRLHGTSAAAEHQNIVPSTQNTASLPHLPFVLRVKTPVPLVPPVPRSLHRAPVAEVRLEVAHGVRMWRPSCARRSARALERREPSGEGGSSCDASGPEIRVGGGSSAESFLAILVRQNARKQGVSGTRTVSPLDSGDQAAQNPPPLQWDPRHM